MTSLGQVKRYGRKAWQRNYNHQISSTMWLCFTNQRPRICQQFISIKIHYSTSKTSCEAERMQLQSFITKQKLKFKRKRSQKLKGKNGWIKKLYVHCRDTDMKKPAWQPFCWSQVLSFNNQQNSLYKSHSIPSCPSLESWCYERNWLKCLNWSGTFWPISVFFLYLDRVLTMVLSDNNFWSILKKMFGKLPKQRTMICYW